jgi:hypothetical protein
MLLQLCPRAQHLYLDPRSLNTNPVSRTMNNTTATALPIDNEWQLINTAPLDRIVLLYRPTATKLAIQVAPGKYETNQYAKNPQPYWEVWLRIWNGVTESRAYPPTHWRDYPSPPLPTLELNHGSAAPAPAQPKPAELPRNMEPVAASCGRRRLHHHSRRFYQRRRRPADRATQGHTPARAGGWVAPGGVDIG